MPKQLTTAEKTSYRSSRSCISPDERRRRAVFLALVKVQDEGEPVPVSRAGIAARFELTVDAVKEIEEEGLKRQWPPLT